jgi:signal transduction histidine kinase
MKLSTRLSLLVGIIVSILSVAIGSFAITSSENSEIASVKSMLNASTTETLNSQEDKFQVAINVADSSPLPLSVAFVTTSPQLSFISENSASIERKPAREEIDRALKNPILVEKSFLIRTIKTGTDQYLLYSMSILAAQQHSQSLLHSLLVFIFVSLLISILSTHFLFRRDSAVNELAKSIQENSDKMQEFLGDASHELRTPLTVIKGYAELMSIDTTNADLPRYLENVKVESLRMERLINDLLLLAELGEGRKLNYSDVSLDAILHKKISEIRDLNPQRVITKEISEVDISTDQSLLEDLLSNIFSNILRHTPPDAPIAIYLLKKRGGFALSIEDGGPGLPNYSIQTFSRFDKSRSRENGGSGLGLSIMQRIASTLGATITFSQSSLGGLKVSIQKD